MPVVKIQGQEEPVSLSAQTMKLYSYLYYFFYYYYDMSLTNAKVPPQEAAERAAELARPAAQDQLRIMLAKQPGANPYLPHPAPAPARAASVEEEGFGGQAVAPAPQVLPEVELGQTPVGRVGSGEAYTLGKQMLDDLLAKNNINDLSLVQVRTAAVVAARTTTAATKAGLPSVALASSSRRAVRRALRG